MNLPRVTAPGNWGSSPFDRRRLRQLNAGLPYPTHFTRHLIRAQLPEGLFEAALVSRADLDPPATTPEGDAPMSERRRPPHKTSDFTFNHAYRCTYLDHSEGVRGEDTWYRWVFEIGQVMETVFLHSDNPQEMRLHERLTRLQLIPEQSVLLTRVKYGDEPYAWKVELDQQTPPASGPATSAQGAPAPASTPASAPSAATTPPAAPPSRPSLKDLAQLMRDCIVASGWAWRHAGVDTHTPDNVQATASTLFIDARKQRLSSAATETGSGEATDETPSSSATGQAAAAVAQAADGDVLTGPSGPTPPTPINDDDLPF
ncbi:hypothetical protein ACFL6X_08190 [Candidatus Latescibacterota bacterium]